MAFCGRLSANRNSNIRSDLYKRPLRWLDSSGGKGLLGMREVTGSVLFSGEREREREYVSQRREKKKKRKVNLTDHTDSIMNIQTPLGVS